MLENFTQMHRTKRFKPNLTSLESLPNEIFVEIFGYVSSVDTVYAFSHLNERFRHLTLEYCTKFDFKSVNKTKFDRIVREHINHKWQSLSLSDDVTTPGQVAYFCQLYPLVENIPQLHSLSITNASINTTSLFLSQLNSLTCIVSLTIGSVCGDIIPTIELPTLTHLVINSCMQCAWMKKLRLKSLHYTIEHNCAHEHNLVWPKCLKSLKIHISKEGDNEIVRTSLKDLPMLTRLSISDVAWENSAPDGHVWERLIRSSMPQLINFTFYFKFWMRDFDTINQLKRIVSTFSTPFYLKEKSWFIQCDTHKKECNIAILYSLPFAFEHFEIVTHSFHTSLSTNYEQMNSYKNIKELTVSVQCKTIDEKLNLKTVTDLTLKTYDASMKWIFSMTNLNRLSLGFNVSLSTEDLVHLLNNNCYLRALAISYNHLELLTNSWKSRTICQLLSCKIRSLEICSLYDYDYIKVDQLLRIMQVFYARCLYLSISVYSRNLVAGLILRHMRHLRGLKVRLQENNAYGKLTKEWLRSQNTLYKNLDCSIFENGNEYLCWFGCRS